MNLVHSEMPAGASVYDSHVLDGRLQVEDALVRGYSVYAGHQILQKGGAPGKGYYPAHGKLAAELG